MKLKTTGTGPLEHGGPVLLPARGGPGAPANPGACERVVLTGFMGCGKSTVGRRVAAALGWEFVDLDDAVAARTGMSVPEIFARQGETAFRTAEAEALRDVLERRRVVVALGGGAPETAANRERLRSDAATCVVWLSGDFDQLRRRCEAQARTPGAVARPVFADLEGARQRFVRREALYREVTSVEVAAGAMAVDEAVAAVVAAVSARGARAASTRAEAPGI